MNTVHLNGNPEQCTICSLQVAIVLRFHSSIVRNLAISLATVVLYMIGNPFAWISLMKYNTTSSTCIFFSFLHPVEHFIVAFQKNVEFRVLYSVTICVINIKFIPCWFVLIPFYIHCNYLSQSWIIVLYWQHFKQQLNSTGIVLTCVVT